MASIFLSYARVDIRKAERVANALEAAGHSVWWDRQLNPGERFSAEIDRALKGADIIVALWSKASIESAWVQDEAGVGRDTARLVPALLDQVAPPLGFRQYHAVDLSRGRLNERSLEPLVKAVEDRLSGKYAEIRGSSTAVTPFRRKALVGAAVLAVLFTVAAAWWLLKPASSSAAPSIVIEAAESNSPMAEMVARSVADELDRFGAGPLAGLDIKPAGQRATYLAQTRVVESPSKLTIHLALGSRGTQNLWSTRLEGASNQLTDLNRQAAAMLGAALQCDFDADKARPVLAADVRALYIDGCARLADPRASPNETVNALRQVTQKAPRFAPGWAKLSYAEFSGIDYVAPSEASNIAWSAGRHIDAASRLDPTLPEVFYVRAFDRNWGPGSAAEALASIDEGLHENPDSALLNEGRADILRRIGRIEESLESAKRATDLNPLSPAILQNYVMALVYSGQSNAAKRALQTAESNWTRSTAIAQLRFMFDLRYGDPANALRMLRDNEVPDITPDETMELYLQARSKPTAANVEAVLRSYRAGYEKRESGSLSYAQALAQFGKVDAAYRLLATAPLDSWYSNTEILFRPYMKAFRADPRFMAFANRLGLLGIWKKSGVWPDFCKDPKLPYDCRQVGMKYPAEPS
ncbi:MAG TPA: TIR domain-containing protein [Sphingomicrobium sp.]|nr:TIR domain-containing protein [Sphingomicrobium sp.]